MRLLTRSDFDGLACAVLLCEAGIVDDFKFVHPRDVQDGKIEIDANDVLANIPYAPGCGLWFDHHTSEKERLHWDRDFHFEGRSDIVSSCARVVYDYYGGAETFRVFEENGMLAAVDKCDSGQYTLKDVCNPAGWIMLSFLMDPRTGLGFYKDYRISNHQLMKDMIGYCRTMQAEQILQLPDVQERVDRYYEQEREYERMIRAHSVVDGDVLIINLLEAEPIYAGNRFKEYALFPEQNISLRIMWGFQRQNIVFACGHSIFNRSSQTNVGKLMLQYGGGGHTRVGTCQVPISDWERCRDEIVEAMKCRIVTT